jgi:hypothetical protein
MLVWLTGRGSRGSLPDPRDILQGIWHEMSHIGFPKHASTPAEWHEWRRSNTVFTDIAATQPGQAILASDAEPEEVPGRKVTANLWTVLGVMADPGRFHGTQIARNYTWMTGRGLRRSSTSVTSGGRHHDPVGRRSA